jgi:tRNA/tmRNA/rRNA uracil-C5-methylase (TrmA/RlmC/RlmD family)
MRRLMIEKVAPTGEGIVRTAQGTGFVAGALPGEEVDVEVTEVHKKYWKGRVIGILAESKDRYRGSHATCAGCDWAHWNLSAARAAKRGLFLESMSRLGAIPSDVFGELPVVASALAYRLRARFHVEGRGDSAVLGFYRPGSHRAESAAGCLALSAGLRELLPQLAQAIARAQASVSEISIAESFDAATRVGRVVVAADTRASDGQSLCQALGGLLDGVAVVAARGKRLAASGRQEIWQLVCGRELPIAAGVFFQANRFLVSRLFDDVCAEAAGSAGRAIDAFSGVGLFAGALLKAGHRVVSVESSSGAVRLAREAQRRWRLPEEETWRIVRSGVLPFLAAEKETFDLAVADPPRAGLCLPLAAHLAERIGRRLILVSCEPATLARDLAAILAKGWKLTGARLYDLFALTHRIESVVTLERTSPS